MDADATALLRLAFEQAPAALANPAITHVRDEVGRGDARAISYEVLLPDGNTRAYLLGTLRPRLVSYLESVGARPPRCAGVFLSVFAGDTLHFIHARDALALFSRWERPHDDAD